jgi:hypothetical protein
MGIHPYFFTPNSRLNLAPGSTAFLIDLVWALFFTKPSMTYKIFLFPRCEQERFFRTEKPLPLQGRPIFGGKVA